MNVLNVCSNCLSNDVCKHKEKMEQFIEQFTIKNCEIPNVVESINVVCKFKRENYYAHYNDWNNYPSNNSTILFNSDSDTNIK